MIGVSSRSGTCEAYSGGRTLRPHRPIVADYELVADIARTYGRIEELRWRLRTRTQLALQGGLEGMTSALLAELIPETEALLDDILDEMEDPHVQRRGIMYLEPMEATVGTRRRSRPR